MLSLLAPKEFEEKFKEFKPVLYSNIEEEMYSRFWDIVIVKDAASFSKVKDFSKYGTLFINVGGESLEEAFNLPAAEAVKALMLFEKVIDERRRMNKMKRIQQLMLEPVTVSRKMAEAYEKLKMNSLSRLSIVMAEDGLLEEWILWPLLENYEIIDFAISSEEEMLLRIFGTKNHPSLLSREGVLLLRNCDLCSTHVMSKISQAIILGFFKPYLSEKKMNSHARVIFHFKSERNIPPFLRQLAGLSFSEVPPLREVRDSLPTVLKLFLSLLGQEISQVKMEISQDVVNRIKKSKWEENWREFLNFCKSFSSGEERIHRDLISTSSIPKLKEYVKSVEAVAEKQVLQRALEIYGFNRIKLSKVLGINPKTLMKKLKLYGLVDEK